MRCGSFFKGVSFPLLLSFICASSTPAFALKTQAPQEASGLEELAGKLKEVARAAGLEEPVPAGKARILVFTPNADVRGSREAAARQLLNEVQKFPDPPPAGFSAQIAAPTHFQDALNWVRREAPHVVVFQPPPDSGEAVGPNWRSTVEIALAVYRQRSEAFFILVLDPEREGKVMPERFVGQMPSELSLQTVSPGRIRPALELAIRRCFSQDSSWTLPRARPSQAAPSEAGGQPPSAAPSGLEEQPIFAHRGGVVSLAFVPFDSAAKTQAVFKLATVGTDGSIRIWDWRSGSNETPRILRGELRPELGELPGDSAHRNALQVTPIGARSGFLTVSPREVKKYEYGMGTTVGHVVFEQPISESAAGYSSSVAISPGRTSALFVGRGPEAVIQNLDEKRQNPGSDQPRQVLKTIRSPTGAHYLSAVYRSEPQDAGWKRAGGRRPRRYEGWVPGTDGRLVALGTSAHTVELWQLGDDLDTPARLSKTWPSYLGQVLSVAFSPDGKLLASADNAGFVQIADLEQETSHRLRHSRGDAQVSSLAFSHDGVRLVSAENGAGEVRMWEARTGKLLGRIMEEEPVLTMAFSPDDTTVAIGRRDGYLRLAKVNRFMGAGLEEGPFAILLNPSTGWRGSERPHAREALRSLFLKRDTDVSMRIRILRTMLGEIELWRSQHPGETSNVKLLDSAPGRNLASWLTGSELVWPLLKQSLQRAVEQGGATAPLPEIRNQLVRLSKQMAAPPFRKGASPRAVAESPAAARIRELVDYLDDLLGPSKETAGEAERISVVTDGSWDSLAPPDHRRDTSRKPEQVDGAGLEETSQWKVVNKVNALYDIYRLARAGQITTLIYPRFDGGTDYITFDDAVTMDTMQAAVNTALRGQARVSFRVKLNEKTAQVGWHKPSAGLEERLLREARGVGEGDRPSPLSGGSSGMEPGFRPEQVGGSQPVGLEESAMSFVAVTVPRVPGDIRAAMDKQVRGVIGLVFGQKRVLEFGPGTAGLKGQSKDEGLRKRGEEAYGLLVRSARQRKNELASTLEQHRFVLVASDDDPALLHVDRAGRVADEEGGVFHLLGSSGNFDWQGTTQSPGSHYVKLALIEDARAAFPREADLLRFLGAWAAHEAAVLEAGQYVPPSAEDEALLNEGYEKIRAFRYGRRLDQAQRARENALNGTILEFANVRLGDHMVTTGIPRESIAAAAAVLEGAKGQGQIEAYHLLPAADDLSIQVNHHHGPRSPSVGRLIEAAGTAALQAAADKHVASASGVRLLAAAYRARVKGLGIRREFSPMNERGAEPTLVAKAINGGAGAFNRPIMRSLFMPDTHPSARIGGDTFTAVVENIKDVRRGRKDRPRYVFPPDKMKELMALVGDHSEYVITEVYASTGRFLMNSPGEPVVKVIIEPVDAEGYSDRAANPTMVARVQSGSEALGVFTDALANPWIAPGGPNDAYHLTTIPVSKEQANQPPQRGYINVAAYEYMQYGDGRMPMDRDIIDPFNPVARPDSGLIKKFWGDRTPELQVPFQLAQERAHKVANFLMSHGEMDPFLTARGAEALSGRTAAGVSGLWRNLPKTEAAVGQGGEVDPVVALANAASQGRTFSIIKADAGGEGGHLIPPAYFALASEASLAMMQEDELIRAGAHFAEGDDNEVLSVHRNGMDNHDVHAANYAIFWRMVYLANNYELLDGKVTARSKPDFASQTLRVLGAKIYASGQDLVSEAARGIPVPQLAAVNDRFVDRMVELLRRVDRHNQADALAYGYKVYKADAAVDVPVATTPFGGNITGQGPGFSEMPLPPQGPVRIAAFFTDKDGPAAFNPPVVWMLRTAVERGLIRAEGGAIAEIYDTKKQKHIYLDVETQMDVILGLAANPDTYNFKRVVSKKKTGWKPENPLDYIGDRWFISSSAEKLSVITGGEYRGKDDSVMIALGEFGGLGVEFNARFSYFTQGDGFGSHYTTVRPEPLPTAIATMQSRAVQSALWIDISGDDRMTFTEIYTDPAFRGRRREGEEITHLIWEMQGSEFTPAGVGWRRVERSYPLAQMIIRITGVDWDLLADTTADATKTSVAAIVKRSEFAVAAHVDAAEPFAAGEWVEQFPALNHQASAETARMAHDTRSPKTVVLHESFFGQGPDGAIAIQRTLGELGFDSPEAAVESGAVTLAIALEQTVPPKHLNPFIETVNAASDGAVQLKPEWFTAVEASEPGEDISAAIGPSTWLEGAAAGASLKVAFDKPEQADRVRSAASVFHAALASLAEDNPALAEEVASSAPTLVQPELSGSLQAYRDAVGLEEGPMVLDFTGAAGRALQQAPGIPVAVVAQTPTDAGHYAALGVPGQQMVGLLWGGLEEADYLRVNPDIREFISADPTEPGWQGQVGRIISGRSGSRPVILVTDEQSFLDGLSQLDFSASGLEEMTADYSTAQDTLSRMQ